MGTDKIISFQKEFDLLKNEIDIADNDIHRLKMSMNETSTICNSVIAELGNIPELALLLHDSENLITPDDELSELDSLVNDIIIPQYKDASALTSLDVIVGILAGAVAAVIDIFLVGSPEVVQLYRGGENFDGSILTAVIRKIGNGDDNVSKLLKWLSVKCKVPYDIAAIQGVANPNNHRLRNFDHDPLIGVLFAIVDIIMGTATFVDDNGMLRIIVNPKDYPVTQKYLALVYYIGHLISDVCTARGLPIPGFILTQFFTNGEETDSLAKVCELMYKDGYDLRHLISMSTPVVIKNFIIEVYVRFFRNNKETFNIQTIADKEIAANEKLINKQRIMLISDAISCTGNVIKFFVPPTSGNVTALNLPEWISLIKSLMTNLKYCLRDKDIETIQFNRKAITQNWNNLQS